MFPKDIQALSDEVTRLARNAGVRLVTAESCTGGLVAGALTDIAGSSDAVDRGFVTYSNPAKVRMLGVPQAMLDAHGAVSEATARAMAEGAVRESLAQVSVAITGIAGPGGGSPDKPVGLVWFAAAGPEGLVTREMRFGDIGRSEVRLASVRVALEMLRDRIPHA